MPISKKGALFFTGHFWQKLIPFEEITRHDIVLIPAFGTTLKIEEELKSIGVVTEQYNTTCPFVEKVWNRSRQIAEKNIP